MVDVDPNWINASAGSPQYHAAELRRNEAVLLSGAGEADRLGAREGVRPGAAAVSLAGTTVTVHDVPVVIYPGLTSVAGPYRAALLATSFTLNAADAINPRKDIIVAQVQDHDEDSSTFRRARPVYVAGTPAATPAEPALPAGSFRLATVDVPAGVGTPTLTYNAPWVVASGGVLPVRNDAALPGTAAGLYDGATRWNIAENRLEVHDGVNAWEPVASAKGFQLWQVVKYTANDNFIKANFPGARLIKRIVQAGGGAGGGAVATAASQTSCGGGGQAGCYAESWVLVSALAASEPVTVGAGGVGASGASGGAGGATSTGASGTLISVPGGEGGLTIGASGNPAGAAGGNATQTATAGASVTIDLEIDGGGGSGGFKGGASGGMGGSGGNSHLGGGAASVASSITGDGGRRYGGGGGGALNGASQAAKAGGNGGAGIVIYEIYV